MAESQLQMAGVTVGSRDERQLLPMLGATTIVLLIAASKLLVHLYAGHRYGRERVTRGSEAGVETG